MQEEHRRAIQNNFGSLVEQTDLDIVVSALYEKGVFSEVMIEPYRDTNKDQRTRKRQLYRDIERRGPTAFVNLLETLTENGYWGLVRDLDPESALHPREEIRRKVAPSLPTNSEAFVSLSTENHKTERQRESQHNQQSTSKVPYPPDFRDPQTADPIPSFNVVKSKVFHEGTGAFPLYPTRSRARGTIIAFSFIDFKANIEESRIGAEVDCNNLKYLFQEIGFKTLFYKNLDKEQTLKTLDALDSVPAISAGECVFVVVSSHGYRQANTSDTDIRCSDGQLISATTFLERFNVMNFPKLKDKPKVFVFQTCRGGSHDYVLSPPAHMEMPGRRSSYSNGTASYDGSASYPEQSGDKRSDERGEARRADDALKDSGYELGRLYSDMLIAHSTLPGFVSHREKTGSWYIQVLCDVFAAHAHEYHVEELLTKVDTELERRFKIQTSSIDKWGFNHLLYLHPGLFEDNDSSCKSLRNKDS